MYSSQARIVELLGLALLLIKAPASVNTVDMLMYSTLEYV